MKIEPQDKLLDKPNEDEPYLNHDRHKCEREEEKRKQIFLDNEETFSEPSDFNDSDHIQQQEIEQILKSNSKCLLEHQLWINSTKFKKWKHSERNHKEFDQQRYIIRWKIAIYGKFVSELERRLKKIAQGNDLRWNFSSL